LGDLVVGEDAELLSPDPWFSRGHSHDGGYYDENRFWRLNIRAVKFIWAPPPAAVDVAVEELRKALIKRRDCTHIFLCPRLLTPQWKRPLNKACDLVLFMQARSEAWPIEMYPFLSVRPWQVRGTPKMLFLGRKMSGLLEDSNEVTGDLLRKLCKQMWNLLTMAENVVRKVLYFSSYDTIPCEAERRF
jgi:hypothetical protein